MKMKRFLAGVMAFVLLLTGPGAGEWAYAQEKQMDETFLKGEEAESGPAKFEIMSKPEDIPEEMAKWEGFPKNGDNQADPSGFGWMRMKKIESKGNDTYNVFVGANNGMENSYGYLSYVEGFTGYPGKQKDGYFIPWQMTLDRKTFGDTGAIYVENMDGTVADPTSTSNEQNFAKEKYEKITVGTNNWKPDGTFVLKKISHARLTEKREDMEIRVIVEDSNGKYTNYMIDYHRWVDCYVEVTLKPDVKKRRWDNVAVANDERTGVKATFLNPDNYDIKGMAPECLNENGICPERKMTSDDLSVYRYTDITESIFFSYYYDGTFRHSVRGGLESIDFTSCGTYRLDMISLFYIKGHDSCQRTIQYYNVAEQKREKKTEETMEDCRYRVSNPYYNFCIGKYLSNLRATPDKTKYLYTGQPIIPAITVTYKDDDGTTKTIDSENYDVYYEKVSGEDDDEETWKPSTNPPTKLGSYLVTILFKGKMAEEYCFDWIYVEDNGEVWKGADSFEIVSTLPEEKKVEKITLSLSSQSLTLGNTIQLNAVVSPDDAENKTLSWSSDNNAVATVSENGLVTAVAPGKATITVSSTDGSNIKESCVITVAGGSAPSPSPSPSPAPSPSPSPAPNPDPVPDIPAVVSLYYVVQFDANGGQNLSRKKMTLSMDDSLGILPTVQRENYKFGGWYTERSGGKKVMGNTVLNSATTLYAQWTKVSVNKVTSLSLKSQKSGQAEVSYKKVSGAAGYQITYATNKNFNSSATKKKVVLSESVILKGLKKRKTYYVRVRAYKIDSAGKKVYGKYSVVKKVKVK